MSVNNLSPINQKFIKAGKENASNQQPQVDLTQKPDTVSFGGKKVARNTGIGAILGAALGGFIKNKKIKNVDFDADIKFSNGNRRLIGEYGQTLQQHKMKIENEFWTKALGLAKKVINGTELSDEEAAMAKTFNLNSPHMNFLYKDESVANNVIECLRGIQEKPCDARIIFQRTKSSIYHASHRKLLDEFVKYCSGDETSREFIDTYSDEIKKLVYKKDIPLEHPNIAWMEHVLPKLKQEMFYPTIINEENIMQTADNYVKSSLSKIKNNLKSQIIKKETLKTAGIGAAIAGGVALIGSLIYKAVKNKKVEQNK